MIRRWLLAASLFAAFALTGAAHAGSVVPLPGFTALDIHGGARVVLHHGAVAKVTILSGDLAKADLHVSGTTLSISPCKTPCWGHHEIEVEVISPAIAAIETHGGGALRAEGTFPRQPSLSLSAHGGGAIDTRAIAAETVNAEAHGGGAIQLQALNALNAETHGGGAINFTGHPAQVNARTHGGGAIDNE
jgi:hypothetical protein